MSRHDPEELRYFEDFVVGEERVSPVEYVVTVDELKSMSRRWDPQPFHLDEHAPETKEFGGLITCSAHTFAIFTHITSHDPLKSAAIAGLGFDAMRMLQPIRPGDRIRAVSSCLERRESRSKPDRGIIVGRTVLRNQRGEDVFTVQSTTMMRRRPRTATRDA